MLTATEGPARTALSAARDVCIRVQVFPPSDLLGRAGVRQAAVVMDFHAHLSGSEVIGLLGGRWDAEARRLAVTHAFPCRPAQARPAPPASPSLRVSAPGRSAQSAPVGQSAPGGCSRPAKEHLLAFRHHRP